MARGAVVAVLWAACVLLAGPGAQALLCRQDDQFCLAVRNDSLCEVKGSVVLEDVSRLVKARCPTICGICDSLGAPANVTATRLSESTGEVTWNRFEVIWPTGLASPVTGFVVFQQPNNVSEAEVTTITVKDASATSVMLQDLDDAVDYQVMVQATGHVIDSALSGTVTLSSHPRAPPINLSSILLYVLLPVGLSILLALFFVVRFRSTAKESEMKYNELYEEMRLDSERLEQIPEELSDVELPREAIKLDKELGEGQFGSVLSACITLPEGGMWVAAKLLKNSSDPSTALAFMQEAQRLKALDHPHVVKLVATHFRKRPRMLFVELMKSDVKQYLRANRPLYERAALISNVEQLSILVQVSDGLRYLAQNRAVHRDIAARNVLIGDGGIFKISDFGEARTLAADKTYYRKIQGVFPLRWMAPESLREGLFSVSTDIFSFAVLAWEVYTFAERPWNDVPNSLVLENVLSGARLTAPAGCPPEIARMMEGCWQSNPMQRPTAEQIYALVSTIELADETFACSAQLSVGDYNQLTYATGPSKFEQRRDSQRIGPRQSQQQEHQQQQQQRRRSSLQQRPPREQARRSSFTSSIREAVGKIFAPRQTTGNYPVRSVREPWQRVPRQTTEEYPLRSIGPGPSAAVSYEPNEPAADGGAPYAQRLLKEAPSS